SSVCAALHAAHELEDDAGRSLGLVHGNLTPDSLLITTLGVVRVIDFGLARVKARCATKRDVAAENRAPYTPPEGFSGRAIDRRSDVFSVGVLLYAMATGRLPFGDDQPVPGKGASIPRELDALLSQALESDPDCRFASAAAMRRAIDEIALSHARV